MSSETSAWAKEQRCGDPVTKAVLMEIANWAKPSGCCEFLSVKRIAEVVEISERTVQRHIARLETSVAEGGLGLIQRAARLRNDGGQGANGFDLVGYRMPSTPPRQSVTPRCQVATGPRQLDGEPGDNRVTRLGDKINTLSPPSGGDAPTPDFSSKLLKEKKVCITEDWTPPPVSELPAKVRALVSTWPSGAYQAVCETFRLHYLAEDRQRTPAQWLARLGAWLTADHAKVLRDAKAGVSFAALAPVQAGTAVAKRPPTAPPDCKDDEDERSGAVHAALQASEGEANWRAWLQPCAILISGGDTQPSVTVVTTSDFLRDAVQSRFEQAIRTAARTAFGKTPGWVRFDAQRPAAIARTGTDG